MLPSAPAKLPSYAEVLADMVRAEQAEGWVARCAETGRFLVLNDAFISALATVLRSLRHAPIVEVCAGHGELAAALADCGIDVTATDADPLPGTAVMRLDAAQAVERFQPQVVIGSFVPCDAGVDEAVLAAPCVAEYLVLNARVDGQLGSSALWRTPGWRPIPLPDVARLMITRHDVWLGPGRSLRHGEAWLFRREGQPR